MLFFTVFGRFWSFSGHFWRVVANFDKSYLGARKSFFNSVKSICFPIIQILKYDQMIKFDFFWLDPPYPLKLYQQWAIQTKILRFMWPIFFLNHFSVRITNPKEFSIKSRFWRLAGRKSGISHFWPKIQYLGPILHFISC